MTLGALGAHRWFLGPPRRWYLDVEPLLLGLLVAGGALALLTRKVGGRWCVALGSLYYLIKELIGLPTLLQAARIVDAIGVSIIFGLSAVWILFLLASIVIVLRRHKDATAAEAVRV
jgi:hypothetical protein